MSKLTIEQEAELDALARKAESGADWAEVCRRESEMLGSRLLLDPISPRSCSNQHEGNVAASRHAVLNSNCQGGAATPDYVIAATTFVGGELVICRGDVFGPVVARFPRTHEGMERARFAVRRLRVADEVERINAKYRALDPFTRLANRLVKPQRSEAQADYDDERFQDWTR